MLEVRRLKCVRGQRTLFESLSFSLSAGEFLQLTGANGSGKTSLLRLLCGLTGPSAGEIRWMGADIRELGEDYNHAFIYLGHRPAVKDELTAAENLRFWSEIRGVDISTEQTQRALEAAGLIDFQDYPARLLSDGLRRRLALARLLICNAKLWLLDETLTSLDSNASAWITAVMQEHRTRGGMIIMATHERLNLSPSTRSLHLAA
jgi:heme exporter protein A